MKVVYLKNFRMGLATNSSSTHSVIYRNNEELFEDLNIFELDYYDRCDFTIAASKRAKEKYILASVWRNESLVKMLVERYPSMKEYFPLIKKTADEYKNDDDDYETFGMYTRGNLCDCDNLEFSYDFCCDVIDDDRKIIIGGSDERDDVYDAMRGHEVINDVGDLDYNESVYKNGNYYYGFGRKFLPSHTVDGKIRFCFDDVNPVPEMPELVDLKITGMCNHGCPMCFENSNINGKHADISYLCRLVRELSENGKRCVEFSIGGGNVLLYPELQKLLQTINKYNCIGCITIKADDVDTIVNDNELIDMLRNSCRGIGVSVFNENDAEKVKILKKALHYGKSFEVETYVTAHIIPEYIGYDMAMKIKDLLDYKNSYYDYAPILYLGYKRLGRGENFTGHTFTDAELDKLFGDSLVHIDTKFCNTYKDYIGRNFQSEYLYTTKEGEYSMYIDAVNKTCYKSSYDLKKKYELEYPNSVDIIKVFGQIRNDGGLPAYKDVEKHYWD